VTSRVEIRVAQVRTVLLGQFVDENAERIVEQLERAGIGWYVKRSGGLARVLFAGDWGTRIFVEEPRLAEAQSLAREVLGPDA
jgi:hypothetical protein